MPEYQNCEKDGGFKERWDATDSRWYDIEHEGYHYGVCTILLIAHRMQFPQDDRPSRDKLNGLKGVETAQRLGFQVIEKKPNGEVKLLDSSIAE